ncbi:MAG: hypothetical protein N3G74_00345 [Candidatus Micrarchaeota archaeon]|nr:hypothetical protein [Candidatus Micrarchaeota archaeon]
MMRRYNIERSRKIEQTPEMIKEQLIKDVEESELLIKRADIVKELLQRKIQHDKECLNQNVQKTKTIKEIATSLNSNSLNERISAVNELVVHAKIGDKEEKYAIRNLLIEKLRDDIELAEEVIMAFFELYMHDGFILPIKWAAKNHTSQKIRELAEIMLLEISKIERVREKENWKKIFKEKINMHRQRKEQYNEFKDKLKLMTEDESFIEFKRYFIGTLSSFISLHSLEDKNLIKEKLNETVAKETIEKVYISLDKKAENLDLIKTYYFSIKLACAFLRNNISNLKNDEINKDIENTYCNKT